MTKTHVVVTLDDRFRSLAFEYRKKGVLRAYACPLALELYEIFGSIWTVGLKDAVDDQGRYIRLPEDVGELLNRFDDGRYYPHRTLVLEVEQAHAN